MTNDQIQRLTDFRSEVPAPNAEAAERAYSRAISERRHRWGKGRMGSSRSRMVLVASAGALVLVPTGVAYGGKIVHYFEGTTPPSAVSTAYATMNRGADAAIKRGFAAHFPQADISRIRGVVEIQTADGPEDLWAAPNDDGGECWFVDFANDPAGESGQPGSGTCDASTPPSSAITFEDFRVLSHPTLLTVFGRVYVQAESVKISLASGSTVTAPVVEGFYLASLDTADEVAKVTAYDASGDAVGGWARP